MKYISKTTKLFSRNKLVFAFAMVLSFSIFATSASALGSSRDYFDVAKNQPTSQVCEGGSWVIIREWSWRHGVKRIQKWQPNWYQLGFRNYDQCVRYTTTGQPTSKEQCRREWRSLGFKSYGDCKKYLKLHPGGGYGGTQVTPNNRDDDGDENERD